MDEDEAVGKLLKWLEKHVTEQRRIGIQPVALVVISSVLILAIAWIWHTKNW